MIDLGLNLLCPGKGSGKCILLDDLCILRRDHPDLCLSMGKCNLCTDKTDKTMLLTPDAAHLRSAVPVIDRMNCHKLRKVLVLWRYERSCSMDAPEIPVTYPDPAELYISKSTGYS